MNTIHSFLIALITFAGLIIIFNNFTNFEQPHLIRPSPKSVVIPTPSTFTTPTRLPGQNWPLVKDSKPIDVVENRNWSPPKEYNSNYDQFLTYESELNQGLSKPTIENSCPNSTKVVIVVMSSHDNRQKRDAVRETWAKVAPHLNVSIFFALGSKSATIKSNQFNLIAENELFHDLILFNFEDTYFNLTLKVVAGLDWSVTNCGSANYVIKTDDDMYLDLPYLVDELNQRDHNSNSMYGFYFSEGTFPRNPKAYHYVPMKVYHHRLTPPYFFGWLEIFERDSLLKLMDTIKRSTPILYIEDVFITGFMAQSAKIKQIGLNHDIAHAKCRLKAGSFETKVVIGDSCKPNDLLRIHREKTKLLKRAKSS